MEALDRGKRRSAKRILTSWGLLTAAAVGLVAWGGLNGPELEALLSIHGTVTTFASLSVLVLFGLDGLAEQIIPAWRGKQ